MVCVFTLKRARTSDLQRIRCEGRQAREPVLVRNHLEVEGGTLRAVNAESFLPGFDALLRVFCNYATAFRAAYDRDAAINPNIWIMLSKHFAVCP